MEGTRRAIDYSSVDCVRPITMPYVESYRRRFQGQACNRIHYRRLRSIVLTVSGCQSKNRRTDSETVLAPRRTALQPRSASPGRVKQERDKLIEIDGALAEGQVHRPLRRRHRSRTGSRRRI